MTRQEAHLVCLITWVLTDPDAHERGFGLTAFESWPWVLADTAEPGSREEALSRQRASHTFLEWCGRAWAPLAAEAWQVVRPDALSEATKSL